MNHPQWPRAGLRRRRSASVPGNRLGRRLTVLAALSAVLLATAPAAGAQAQAAPAKADLAPYVVIMEAEPTAAQDASGARTTGDTAAQLEREQDQALAEADVADSAKLSTFTTAINGFSAALTAEQAADVARQPGVARVFRDQLRQLHTDTSPGFLGLDARRGAWASDLDGEGVVLGVVDTGIWPEHPSFADDGSYAAPPADWMGGDIACEFGDTAYNPDDAPFDCNNKLIGARDMRILYKQFVGAELYNSTRDYNGHGTHTASTAGGNQDVASELFGVDRGNVSGIAHRAQVAMYSACGNSGCFGGDLAAAINAAVADGVDVINYSIGGGAALNGPDDIAFLLANAAGVFTATSNGNAGPGAGTVGSPANDPWVMGVGANTHDRTFEGTVTLGDGREFTGASVTNGTDEATLVDSADHGNELCDPAVDFSPPVTDNIVLCARGVQARVDKGRAVFEQGGAGMVLFNENDAQGQVTDNHFLPSVNTNFTDGQTIKAYIDSAGAGATASITGGEAVEAEGSVMADFSSRGPTTVAPSLIKPDVTAPGVNILAGNTPTPDPTAEGASAPGELFQAISGTSMASPHVAGVLALIKQAHPDWTPAMAQSAVMTTARDNVLKEDGDTAADPFDMGAGHLNPGQDADRPNSVFNPGLVYNAGFDDYLGFLCDAAPEVLADPVATCADLEARGIPTTVENLNYPSIAAAEVQGTTTVQRTVTSVADNTAIWVPHVAAPKGFDVKVSPRLMVLRPGESKTYTLTISKRNAPFDEWRFGELTWIGVGLHLPYQVESPIALKAVELIAPSRIEGTGTSGDASFDVQFGYDGEYTAAAHGLVSRLDSPDTVQQDPDQTFNPNDPTGTTAHEFTVSNSAHLRFSLTTADLDPPETAVDLDVYLYNSAGEQIASSTAGGTDEHIDLRLPADDTYTFYVHGWQTIEDSVDYVLRSWDVPLTTDGGGSLVLDSAPDAATAGGTGTIDVSWSGLEAGGAYLGAVSHTGPNGLLNVTLVDVTG
ncbi:MAG: S8 family serine peptidase [Micromonosporaceae bacterium]|nr:S8 family serine peptidase [Micromonosporaceae bacterium]